MKNKKKPQKHQSTKNHKAVIVNTIHFSEILGRPCRQTGFSMIWWQKNFSV
jgi:hypothetical protein